MPNGSIAGLAAALALLTAAATASAHAGVPRAFELITEPGSPDALVVRSDGWGFFRSEDAGKTFEWSCSEVYGVKSTTSAHASFVLLKSGRLLVGTGTEGVRYTDDHCGWAVSSGLDGERIAALAVAGDHLVALTSTYRRGVLEDGLFRSDDDGASFTRTSAVFPDDVVLHAVAFAPSDPLRVYVSGKALETDLGVFLRSSDGGATFTRLDAPARDLATLRIPAVHPTMPGVVFLRVDSPEGLGEDAPDSLWMTSTAGESWTEVLAGTGDLPGLALSPDGTRAFAGGPLEGLWLGDVDALIQGEQAALERINERPVWGLLWSSRGLYAGTNEFEPVTVPEAFTLGVSRDEGRSFERVLSTCDARFSRCDAASFTRQVCDGAWRDPLLGGFSEDFIAGNPRCEARDGGAPTQDDGGAQAPQGTLDGGVAGEPRRHPAGGCTLATRRRPAPVPGLLVGLVSAGRWLRRRRPAARAAGDVVAGPAS